MNQNNGNDSKKVTNHDASIASWSVTTEECLLNTYDDSDPKLLFVTNMDPDGTINWSRLVQFLNAHPKDSVEYRLLKTSNTFWSGAWSEMRPLNESLTDFRFKSHTGMAIVFYKTPDLIAELTKVGVEHSARFGKNRMIEGACHAFNAHYGMIAHQMNLSMVPVVTNRERVLVEDEGVGRHWVPRLQDIRVLIVVALAQDFMPGSTGLFKKMVDNFTCLMMGFDIKSTEFDARMIRHHPMTRKHTAAGQLALAFGITMVDTFKRLRWSNMDIAFLATGGWYLEKYLRQYHPEIATCYEPTTPVSVPNKECQVELVPIKYKKVVREQSKNCVVWVSSRPWRFPLDFQERVAGDERMFRRLSRTKRALRFIEKCLGIPRDAFIPYVKQECRKLGCIVRSKKFFLNDMDEPCLEYYLDAKRHRDNARIGVIQVIGPVSTAGMTDQEAAEWYKKVHGSDSDEEGDEEEDTKMTPSTRQVVESLAHGKGTWVDLKEIAPRPGKRVRFNP